MVTKANLKDFYRGWIIGKFDPSLLAADFEVGITEHKQGEPHQDHFHKKFIEINVVLEGSVKINNQVYHKDDIFVLYPYEVSIAEFLTDVKILVVRNGSDPTDKFNFRTE